MQHMKLKAYKFFFRSYLLRSFLHGKRSFGDEFFISWTWFLESSIIATGEAKNNEETL
jgi:hypothetical protein